MYGWAGEVGSDPLELRVRLVELHGRTDRGELGYEPFGGADDPS
jgi:hypothetical protein